MQGNDRVELDYNSRLRQVKSRRMNSLSAQLLGKADHQNEGRLAGATYNRPSRKGRGNSGRCKGA